MTPLIPRTLAVVPVVLLLAACGQGSSGTAGPGSPGPAGQVAGGEFCAVVKQNLATVSGTRMTSLLTGGSPSAWKDYLTAASAANTELAAVAPAEITSAVTTLKNDADSLRTTLAAAGYDPAKVDSSALMKGLASPAHAAASTKFVSYVSRKCGIDLSKAPA